MKAGALLAGCVWGGCDDEGGRADEGSSGAETGSGGPSPVTAEQVRASADALDAATSYAFSSDPTFSGLSEVEGAAADTPDEAELVVNGGTDVEAGRSRIDMDVAEVMTMSGAGAPAPEGDATIRAVVDGEDAYVNYGELGSSFGVQPEQWVRMQVAQLGAGLGGATGGSPSPTSPANFTDLLRGVDADEDITFEGEEDVRGTATSHLVADVDVEQAIAAAPEERRATLQQQFADAGLTNIPLHLWLAEDGLPRRLELIAEPGDLAALNGAGLTIIVEPYDYNAPVTVEVPDAASVIDGGAALGGTPPADG
jgi:hypothetical protein